VLPAQPHRGNTLATGLCPNERDRPRPPTSNNDPGDVPKAEAEGSHPDSMSRYEQKVFPFFVGCGRSGTTLIRVIFNSHPLLAIPRESHFIPELALDRRKYELPDDRIDCERLLAALKAHRRFRRWKLPEAALRDVLATSRDLADAIRGIYALLASRRQKPRYADKTPCYAVDLPLITSLFPEARFVHTIRDGRNVALSLAERSFGPDRVEDAILYWRHQVETARAAGAMLGPGRYFEYRHEDLTRDPESVVARICAFLDLEFVPAMLQYYQGRQPKSAWHRHLAKPPTEGLRDFRSELTATDLRVLETLTGDLLVALGYELSGETDWSGRDANIDLRIAGARLRQGAYLRVRSLRRSRPIRAVRNGLSQGRRGEERGPRDGALRVVRLLGGRQAQPYERPEREPGGSGRNLQLP
jgi:Sulfotransferase family